jgi:hypothetical protein
MEDVTQVEAQPEYTPRPGGLSLCPVVFQSLARTLYGGETTLKHQEMLQTALYDLYDDALYMARSDRALVCGET